jgi:hypothetical protein
MKGTCPNLNHPATLLEELGKTRKEFVRIADFRTEIRTEDIPIMEQEYFSLCSDIRCKLKKSSVA